MTNEPTTNDSAMSEERREWLDRLLAGGESETVEFKALREAIINAVCHRDYLDSGACAIYYPKLAISWRLWRF